MKLAQRLSLRQLRLFISVAETGSFTAAARLMHVTQPAVSQQVRELESLIGEVMFDGRRSFRLTPAGEILLRHARAVIASLELAEVELKAMKGVASGTVSVGAVTTAEYFVPRLLAAFGEAYPDIRFRLTVRNRSGMAELLRERTVDVAIMGAPPPGLSVRRVPFAPDPMWFVAPPGHPLVGRKSVPPSVLAGERLLLREQGSGTRAALERFLRACGVKLVQADEMGSNETLKQAVMAGLGVSFLSQHTFAMEEAAGRIRRLEVRGTPVEREWNVLVPSDKPVTLAVDALVEFLQQLGPGLMAESGARVSR